MNIPTTVKEGAMSTVDGQMYGAFLPSGAKIAIITKNDAERIRNAFKLADVKSDSVAKKLASYVVFMKGEPLKEVVSMFREFSKTQVSHI